MPTPNKLIDKNYLFNQFKRYYAQVARPDITDIERNLVILNIKLNRIINALNNEGITVDLSNIPTSELFDFTISGDSTVAVGSTINLTASESGVTWSSSDESVATVDSSGVVTGLGTGEVTITASKASFNNATKVITVTATEPAQEKE